MPFFARARGMPILAPFVASLVAACAAAFANACAAQTLAVSNTTDSVVARLVASRSRGDQPVMLSTLTSFEWDSFSVIRVPAGESMANCGRQGFLPCGPELRPSPDSVVQVLQFDRNGEPVYEERIMAASGRFADPLPNAVPRAHATLVSCPGPTRQPVWCLKPYGPRPAQRFLDGG
ncbi:hypothetical protein [Cupriavidus plantarum]|uniref:hypothetical protein n=1 Tax=Cupriavidus plantarum TaxID=942865 RepID=UPI00339D88E0